MREQVTVDLSSAILDAFHRGLWPDLSVLAPGSPAYVRRLRDQAAMEYSREYLRFLLRQPSGDTGFNPLSVGIKKANALVSALGYQVPEDAP